MDNNFKTGFYKRALALGFSNEEVDAMYQKRATEDQLNPDDIQRLKSLMSRQGFKPNYGVDDSSQYALQYNNKLLQMRDKLHEKNPEIEGITSGVGHGLLGGALGGLASHAYGLPGWGKGVGAAIGALGTGAHYYNKRKNEVNTAHKLTDPGNMRNMLDYLSSERQFANNQIGNYRNI